MSLENTTHKQALSLSELDEVGGGWIGVAAAVVGGTALLGGAAVAGATVAGWIKWENIVDTSEVQSDLNALGAAASLAVSVFGRRGRRRRR